jgi:undecaprenyl-diphosphatase
MQIRRLAPILPETMQYPAPATTAIRQIRSLAPSWHVGAALMALLLAAYGGTRSVPGEWEVEVTRAIQGADPRPMPSLAHFLSTIGQDPWLSLMALAGIGAMLFWARRPSLAVFLAIAFMLRAVGPLLKAIVDRPRPTSDLVDVAVRLDSPSYPSGHVLCAVLLFGFLIYCVERTVPGMFVRRALQAACASMILLMGYARVEVGAHWPTDVLGGWLIGALMVAGLVAVHRLWERRRALG